MKSLFILCLFMLILVGCTSNVSTTKENLNATTSETYVPLSNHMDINTEEIQANNTTVNIIKGGTYRLSGVLLNGGVVVDCPDQDVDIILSNVIIRSNQVPAIYIKNANKVTLMLDNYSENELYSNGEEFQSVIYATSNIEVQGDGSLYLLSPNYNGITSTKDISINGGNVSVYANQYGLLSTDNNSNSIYVMKGNLYIDSGYVSIASSENVVFLGGETLALNNSENQVQNIEYKEKLLINGGVLLTNGQPNLKVSSESMQKVLNLDLNQMEHMEYSFGLLDENNKLLFSLSSNRKNDLLYFTSPLLTDQNYSIYVDGYSNGISENGFVLDGEYQDGIFFKQIEID